MSLIVVTKQGTLPYSMYKGKCKNCRCEVLCSKDIVNSVENAAYLEKGRGYCPLNHGVSVKCPTKGCEETISLHHVTSKIPSYSIHER